jgi:hypothetical protein
MEPEETMTPARKKELQAEAKHLKSKWDALIIMANEAHKNKNNVRALSLLAEMSGVIAGEMKISMEFM